MFNALFGRKKASERTNEPWDVIRYGSINVPIWRNRARDGQWKYAFSVTRPYKQDGKTRYGRTVDIQNVREVLYGINKLALFLSNREDIPHKDRCCLAKIAIILDDALSGRTNDIELVNGHGGPNSR